MQKKSEYQSVNTILSPDLRRLTSNLNEFLVEKIAKFSEYRLHLLPSNTRSIPLSQSIDYLLADLRNAKDRLEKLPDQNLDSYLQASRSHMGRTIDEVRKDIELTCNVTTTIFQIRCCELANTIQKDEIEENIYSKLTRNAILRAQIIASSLSALRDLDIDPYMPYFSQARATKHFKGSTNVQTASEFILGKSIDEVGLAIRENPSCSECIQFGVFFYKGKPVSENNRSLAAAYVSKIKPVRVTPIFPTQDALNYYQHKLELSTSYETEQDREQFMQTLQLEVENASGRIERSGSIDSNKSAKRSPKNTIRPPSTWITEELSPITIDENSYDEDFLLESSSSIDSPTSAVYYRFSFIRSLSTGNMSAEVVTGKSESLSPVNR